MITNEFHFQIFIRIDGKKVVFNSYYFVFIVRNQSIIIYNEEQIMKVFTTDRLFFLFIFACIIACHSHAFHLVYSPQQWKKPLLAAPIIIIKKNSSISKEGPLFATARENQNQNQDLQHHQQQHGNPNHPNDPTSLFNNDIYRIASRTKSKSSNFNPIHAAEHAERMLVQMISMYHKSNRKTARPNIDTFRIVLMGYANLKGYRWKKHDDSKINGSNGGGGSSSSSFGYSSSAFTNLWGDEFVVDKIKNNSNDSNIDNNNNNNINQEQEEEVNDNDEFDRDEESEETFIKDFDKVEKSVVCSADRVDFIMDQLYQLQKSELEAGKDITSLQLNVYVCNLCLLIYARCSYPQNDESFDEECISHNENNDCELQQEQQQLSTYPYLLPTSQTGSYAERAERMVKHMIFLSKQPDGPQETVEPIAQTYSYLIWSLCKQQPGERSHQRHLSINEITDMNINQYATRASEWLPHLENLYDDFHIQKGEYSHKKRLLRKYVYWAYSDILGAWSKCSAKKSPRKVYKFMTAIENLCEEDQKELDEAHNHDNLIVYNFDKEERAESFKTERLAKSWSTDSRQPSFDEYEPKINRNVPLYPSAQCYTQTILSLSKSKELGSAQRAYRLLIKMLENYDSGDWGKNRPGVYAFNGVISAWANCASSAVGSAESAEKVLNLMERLHFDKSKPDYDHLKPDSVSYNTAIKAWINCKEDAAIFNAEKLMQRMEHRYNAIGAKFLDVKPDSYTYNTMITGWLRSDLGLISLRNAEDLLRKMVKKYLDGDRDLEPNQMIFSSIIDKWAKSDPSKNVAVRHSIDLLKLMESLHERGCTHLKPDKVTYTNIIDAIARSRSPSGASQALSLLDTMERKYKDGDLNIKPSVQTYSCTLLSLLNSSIEDKHIVAQKIPKRMEAIGVSPNAFTWNYIIHVAAYVNGSNDKKMDAFKVALGAFQALRKSNDHKTDSYTYAFFLKAIKHLVPSSIMRSSIAKETFLECANEGKVNDQVLARLFFLLENQELREIFGPIKVYNLRDVKVSDLPPEWGCNVRRSKAKAKQ